MKRSAQAIIAATIICLASLQSPALAQSRFSKGSSFKKGISSISQSRGNSSSRFSSSASRFGSSAKSKVSSLGSSSKGKVSSLGSSSRTSQWNTGKSRLPQLNRMPQVGKPSGSIKLPTQKPQIVKPGWTKPGFGKPPQITKPGPVKLPPVSKLPQIGKPPQIVRPGVPVKPPQMVKPGGPGKYPLPKLPEIKKPNVTLPHHGGVKGHVKPHVTECFKAPHNWKGLVHNIIRHNRGHWCHTRPAVCHWWVSYCTPISHCHLNDLIVCDWRRVHCAPVVQIGAPVQEVQWYLGMKGILLPGKGIGIDAVEPNSPAEQVGLRPGMVLTVCNGIPMADEAAMAEAIRISGGVLNMTLLSEDGTQVLEGTVRMLQVAAVSF